MFQIDKKDKYVNSNDLGWWYCVSSAMMTLASFLLFYLMKLSEVLISMAWCIYSLYHGGFTCDSSGFPGVV